MRALLLAILCMVSTLTFAPAVLAHEDFDCSDFPDREAAQAEVLEDDEFDLDVDGDGQACEYYDFESDTTSSTAKPEATAEEGTSGTASESSLPESGGVPPVLPVLGVMLLVGGGILCFAVGYRKPRW